MKQKLLDLARNPLLLSLVVGLVGVGVANAVSPAPVLVTTLSGLGSGLFCPITDTMFWVLLAVSIIMILWAAFLYVTSEGDAEKPAQARKMVLCAAVGIVIALLARGFPNIVFGLFGQNAATSPLACL